MLKEKGIGKKNILKSGPFSLSAFSSVFKSSLIMETVVRSDGIRQASSLAVDGACSICGQNTCLGQENVILFYRLSEPHNLGDLDLVSNFKTLPKILC